jgi:hypothetical protein
VKFPSSPTSSPFLVSYSVVVHHPTCDRYRRAVATNSVIVFLTLTFGSVLLVVKKGRWDSNPQPSA